MLAFDSKNICIITELYSNIATIVYACTQNISFTIVATDNGEPDPFSSMVAGTVMVVSPDNFFNPVLNQPVYNVTLMENAPINSSVLNFTMTDMDAPGLAAEIGMATIFGPDANFFTVTVTGPNSGEITTK